MKATPDAMAAAATPPAGKCGDGKITVFNGSESAGVESVLFCKDDGTPAIKQQSSTVQTEEKPVVVAVSIDVWNKAWAHAEAAHWKTEKPKCTPQERPMTNQITIVQAGTKQHFECEGELEGSWAELVGEIRSAADVPQATKAGKTADATGVPAQDVAVMAARAWIGAVRSGDFDSLQKQTAFPFHLEVESTASRKFGCKTAVLEDAAALRKALACLQAAAKDLTKDKFQAPSGPELHVTGMAAPKFAKTWSKDHGFGAFTLSDDTTMIDGIIASKQTGTDIKVDGAFAVLADTAD